MLRKLMSACVLPAGDNQIDQPLLDLLQQNISAARAGGQEEAAVFMEKIHAATKKFLITV